MTRSLHLPSWLCAALLPALSQFGIAQEFGGLPPWGREKPTHFSGDVRRGGTFEQPIGGGLTISLTGGWDIQVGTPGHDYSECATDPLHGPTPRQFMAWHFRGDIQSPGGVGDKRWIDFVLNDEDNRVSCAAVEAAAQGKDTSEAPFTGRCWFVPLSVKLSDGPPDQQEIDEMKFDGECALHGGLELWRLPVTYTISDNFTGWATVCFGTRGMPELKRTGDTYQVLFSKQSTIRTSSELRWDSRGAKFVSVGGAVIPTKGPQQKIWGWQNGYSSCGPYQSFFVGTRFQYRTHTLNPLLR